MTYVLSARWDQASRKSHLRFVERIDRSSERRSRNAIHDQTELEPTSAYSVAHEPVEPQENQSFARRSRSDAL
jgi:hypothetical protein